MLVNEQKYIAWVNQVVTDHAHLPLTIPRRFSNCPTCLCVCLAIVYLLDSAYVFIGVLLFVYLFHSFAKTINLQNLILVLQNQHKYIDTHTLRFKSIYNITCPISFYSGKSSKRMRPFLWSTGSLPELNTKWNKVFVVVGFCLCFKTTTYFSVL